MERRTFLGTLTAAIASVFGKPVVAEPAPATMPGSRAEGMDPQARARFPYRHIVVPGGDALATWERLRTTSEGWPVIVGGDEDFARIVEQFGLEDPALPHQKPRTPAQIIDAAGAIRLPETLEQLWRDEYDDPEDGARLPETGDWPSPAEDVQPGLTVANDLGGKPLARVHIIVLPTRDSAEAPAYLRWGDWNACPSPEVHVAVLRDWKRRYGTELVAISGDVLNLRSARRPASREEALALAREQYFYCADIVDQGTGTLAPLAAGLMSSDWWFFWWD